MKGGHLRPEVYFNMPTYIEKYGYEAAAEISKFEVSHLQAIRDLVEKEQIDCDLTLTRTYDVFLDEEYAKTSKQAYDKMMRSGITSIKDAHYTPAKQAELVCDPLNLQRPEVKSSNRGLTNPFRSVVSKALEAASASRRPISGPTNSSCIYSLSLSPKEPIFRPRLPPLIYPLLLTTTASGP